MTAGINLEGTTGSSGCTLANNVSVDNGINSPRTSSNIRVDALSISGTDDRPRPVYLSAGTIQFIWGKTGYTSLAAFRTANPARSTHGLQADPRFARRRPTSTCSPARRRSTRPTPARQGS